MNPPNVVSVSVSNYELDKQKLLLLIAEFMCMSKTFLEDSVESAGITFSGNWFRLSIRPTA